MMEGVALPDWTMLMPGALFAIAGVVAIAAGNRPELRLGSTGLTAATGFLTALLGLNALLREEVQQLSGWQPSPAIDFSFQLDPLRGWFLLIAGVPAIAAGIYAAGYLDAEVPDAVHRPQRKWTDATAALFLASMVLLVVTNSVAAFFFFWEAMAVISFLLVMGDGRSQATRRAAYIYAVMTHAGSVFVLIMFLLLARNAGSLDFPAIQAAATSLESWERHLIFALALLGFGSKAGLIPLHVWLPRAEPLAPAHGAALMSGVLAKMAVFGLVLTIFQLLGEPPSVWGAALLVAGMVSGVLGILYSLMERDSGRILAWSTIENLGIITSALGIAILLINEQQPGLAALALAAALFHGLNHAIFKGLLFLVAGAVQNATSTRDLERLGGLIRHMPRTAIAALTGVAALAALPLLNGFASEWMIYQSLFSLGWGTDSGTIGTGAALAAAALALTSALALVGAVRLFGMAFLAQPRSDATSAATEPPRSMLAAMGFLGALCLVIGLVPMVFVRLLEPVTMSLTGSSPVATPTWRNAADASRAAGNYVPLLVVGLLLIAGVLPWLLIRLRSGMATERVSPTWVCGNVLQPRMQYTATAFAKPLRLIFKSVLRPERSLVVERTISPYVVDSIRYQENLKPVYERYFYEPFVDVMVHTAKHIRRLQSGSVRLYLFFFFVTLVTVIILAR